MATIPHCLFCFDALATRLDSKTYPLQTLAALKSDYARYQAHLTGRQPEPSSTGPTGPAPALLSPQQQHLQPAAAASSSGGSSLEPSRTATPTSSTSGSSATSASSAASAAAAAAAAAAGGKTAAGVVAEGGEAVDELPDRPLFVTWNKMYQVYGRERKELRGCIGTFRPQPREAGLRSYAELSAFDDRRFNKVTLAEVPTLSVSVTLLTDFEPCEQGPYDWDIGTHGLRIFFRHHRHDYDACYLPSVAAEQGWDKDETLNSLVAKACGNRYRVAWHEVAELRVERFQGRAVSLDYDEWKAFDEWRRG